MIDEALKTIYTKAVDCGDLSPHILGLAVDILSGASTAQDSPGVLTIKYRTPGKGRVQTKNLVDIPIPRKLKEGASEESKQTQYHS